MKNKILMFSLIFFAIILLSVNFVSANFFDWITGDVKGIDKSEGDLPTSISSGDKPCKSDSDCGENRVCINGFCATKRTFSRTSAETSIASANNQEKGPRGWTPATTLEGKRCWIPPAKSKSLFSFNGRFLGLVIAE